jgi:AraC family transcriptional regulator
MKDINFEGRCPFSVSENLKIKADSYDLRFDGAIIRYGSISGFRATALKAPFHVFLMNAGNRDVTWDIQVEGKTEEIIMGPDQIFFDPANVPFSRYTADCYEFILVYIDPEKMISSGRVDVGPEAISFEPIYNIWDPQLEFPFKLLLSEVQTGNLNGKEYVDHIISLISLHFMNNYTKDRSKNLWQHIQGLTGEEIANAVYYMKRNMPDDLKRDALIDDLGLARLK